MRRLVLIVSIVTMSLACTPGSLEWGGDRGFEESCRLAQERGTTLLVYFSGDW